MNKIKVKGYRLAVIGLLAFLTLACNPEAPWTTKNVDITMDIQTVSAGFIECEFSTSKNAYYFIDVQPVRKGDNPMDHQKQFMNLALDSAYLAYIAWRHELLEEAAADVAPFSSHSLQYGKIHHFFTALDPNTDYWVYAFVVNPDKIKPEGKLHLATVTTRSASVVDVHYEYRVKGYWDYIYPVDAKGDIYTRFPYLAATRDSLDIIAQGQTPEEYFNDLFFDIMDNKRRDQILYGVKATHNDGWDSYIEFEAGHTYYTAIAGWDGVVGNNVIYHFTWTGEDFESYFHDDDYFVISGENE